MSEELGPQ